MQCVNGCKIPTCKSSMFPVGPILPISSQRKCGMGLIFGVCKIPSCVHWLIFFSSLFSTFISHASRPSPTCDRFYRPQLLCVHLPTRARFFCHFVPLPYLIPWRLFHIFPFLVVISTGPFIQLCLPYSPLSRTLEAISHLSSAGRHIIRSLHPVVPSVLI